MNQPQNPSPTPAAKSGTAPKPVAVLVLDSRGMVAFANQEARGLWQAGARELVGELFPALFALEVVSDDPEMVQAQWEIMLAATLDKTAVLTVQPKEGGPRQMTVRTEKALGAGNGYIVVLEPSADDAAPYGDFADEQAAALQLFAEKGPVGFFDLNLKAGRVLYSPAWKRMLGYADAELPDTYAAWIDLLHPEDSAAAPDKAGRRFKVGARPFAVDFRMRHKQGHWAWIQCVGLQLVSTAGELERVIGIHIDATERKELEEAGVASDGRLHALADEGPLAAFELDFMTGSSWFSEAWLRLLGGVAAPGNGPGALLDALPAGECPDGLESWLLAQAPGQDSFTRMVTLRASDGRAVPVILGLNRTLTRKKTLERLVGFACALTSETPLASLAAPEGSAAQPAGAASAALDEILGVISEGVIAADAAGRILVANATASRLLRLPVGSMIGSPLGEVFSLVDRQSGKPGDNPADRALSASGPLPLIADQALVLAGADPVPVVWTARASYGPDSKPRGIVVVFRNPDEMSLTPEELIKANRFESLGLLAGGIAHDFNNLLTTILGGISLATDNHDLSGLPDSERACLAAKGLTKQLLMFTKGGSGILTVCDSKEIIVEAVKIATAGTTAEVTIEIQEGTGAVKVDRAQIQQVFQNLVLNSLQAMPPPPHRARLQLRASSTHVNEGQIASLPAGDYVEFEVRDNGSGIPPENLERIWDPSSRRRSTGPASGSPRCFRSSASWAGRSACSRPLASGRSSASSCRSRTSRLIFRPGRRPRCGSGPGASFSWTTMTTSAP